MEYGEAITPGARERAVSIARELLKKNPGSPVSIAAEAVARAYCVCVTSGEDDAEHRLSDVHRQLIDAVARRLEDDEISPGGNEPSPQSRTED